MPVDRVWCAPAGLHLLIATVKESTTPGRPSLLFCAGIADTDIGGSSDRVLQDSAEKLSFYCRTEVIGFNPHGVGDADGVLAPDRLLSDLESIASFLAPRPLVMIGFGLVGIAMLACRHEPEVVGIVTVDPLVDQQSDEELSAMGVRLDPTCVFPVSDIPIHLDDYQGRWLAIVPGDRRRVDNLGFEQLVETYQPELHRIFATPSRLHNDPRPYALILGWLERELWTNPVST